MLKGFDLLRSAVGQPEEERTEIAQEIWKMLVDQVWSIGLVGQSPAYMGTRVVNERLETCRRAPASRSIAARHGAAIRSSGSTSDEREVVNSSLDHALPTRS